MKDFNQFINESKDFTKKEINQIFDEVKNYLSENNKTENAYHNNKHMIDVFNNTMTLFDEYQEEYELTENDKLHLGLAALFHDFNHSGGKLKDYENIELALTALKEYLDSTNKSKLYNDIKHIIIATEFPHKDIQLDFLQKIIRDADTMGGISKDWISIVKSLAKEYNKTLQEFIPTQIKFLDTVKFNTDYCNGLLANNKEKIIKELEKMS
jgi:hypothetical protein